MERRQPDIQPQNRIKNSKIACIGDPSRYKVPGRDLEDRFPVIEGGRSGLMVASVIGIPDPWIWMAYLLCLAATALCVVYAAVRGRKQ
jgi:hypothetical protein